MNSDDSQEVPRAEPLDSKYIAYGKIPSSPDPYLRIASLDDKTLLASSDGYSLVTPLEDSLVASLDDDSLVIPSEDNSPVRSSDDYSLVVPTDGIELNVPVAEQSAGANTYNTIADSSLDSPRTTESATPRPLPCAGKLCQHQLEVERLNVVIARKNTEISLLQKLLKQ